MAHFELTDGPGKTDGLRQEVGRTSFLDVQHHQFGAVGGGGQAAKQAPGKLDVPIFGPQPQLQDVAPCPVDYPVGQGCPVLMKDDRLVAGRAVPEWSSDKYLVCVR